MRDIHCSVLTKEDEMIIFRTPAFPFAFALACTVVTILTFLASSQNGIQVFSFVFLFFFYHFSNFSLPFSASCFFFFFFFHFSFYSFQSPSFLRFPSSCFCSHLPITCKGRKWGPSTFFFVLWWGLVLVFTCVIGNLPR